MSQPGLRERKRERTREAIIAAGIELFAERGFKSTRISDIAAAADISPRTFFSYFRRKDDLLFEEQRQAARALADLLASREPGELTIDVLERLLSSGVGQLPSPELLRLRRLRYEVVASEPRLQGPDHSEYADAIRAPLAESYLKDMVAAGVVEPEHKTRLLVGLTIGMTMEIVYMTRESVTRGTREQDAEYLAAVGTSYVKTLRRAFAALADLT